MAIFFLVLAIAWWAFTKTFLTLPRINESWDLTLKMCLYRARQTSARHLPLVRRRRRPGDLDDGAAQADRAPDGKPDPGSGETSG